MPRSGTGSFEPSTLDTVYKAAREHGRGRYTSGLRPSDLKHICGDSNGDVLVIRTKGTAGCPEHMRATLDTLRVRKPGDMRVGYSWDSSFMGQVQKAVNASYVIVIPLGADRAFRWKRSGSGMIKTRESYEDSYGPGEILTLRDGEYIQADISDRDLLSVTWSTDMGPAELLQTVVTSFGLDDETAVGTVTLEIEGDRRIAEGSSGDVIQCIIDNPLYVKFFSVDLGSSTVVWSEPFVKLASSKSAHSEAAISCSLRLAKTRLHQVISVSATNELRRHARMEGVSMELGKAGRHLML